MFLEKLDLKNYYDNKLIDIIFYYKNSHNIFNNDYYIETIIKLMKKIRDKISNDLYNSLSNNIKNFFTGFYIHN